LLQLLNPIALIALAAIALPVVVHLWNVRQGKTLKVGSIALLSASSRQQSTSWRITNWPLLLLRCLLLVLLTLLLAQPVWRKQQSTAQKGWILVPAQQLKEARAQYATLIDSLQKAGLELHNLSADFETINPSDTAALYAKEKQDSANTIAPWSLLRVLDRQLPAGFPLYVFVNNRLTQYQGARPLTRLAIHWKSFDTGDTLQQIAANSWITADGKIKQLDLVSTTAGNYYKENNTAAPSLADVDTATIRIAIYPGSNTTDAQYIQAAVNAIGQYSNRKIDITLVHNDAKLSAGQQLIFWLDDKQPGNEALVALTPTGILFQYDTGQVVKAASWLNNQHQSFRASQSGKLYRYASGPSYGQSVWTLATGEPLLTAEEKEGKRILHFKSRFNPQWGDMVWEEGFVKALLPLVIPELKTSITSDIRRVEDVQVTPQLTNSPSTTVNNTLLQQNATSLSCITWIISLLVFAAERLLAHRANKQTTDA
jgi:hypothetical protein